MVRHPNKSDNSQYIFSETLGCTSAVLSILTRLLYTAFSCFVNWKSIQMLRLENKENIKRYITVQLHIISKVILAMENLLEYMCLNVKGTFYH